jgi:lipopolysaccharide biosynthesis regulator YciM
MNLAAEYLKKAQGCNKDSIRADILLGEMEQVKGNYKTAIKVFNKVIENNPVYLPIIVQLLQNCYEHIGDRRAFKDFLQKLITTNNGITEAIALTQLIKEDDGEAAAALFLKEHLMKNPSLDGLYQLISLGPGNESLTTSETMQLIGVLLEKVVENNPGYKCNNCGFSAKTMHWQCPGCNKWSSIHPEQAIV